MAVEGGGGTGDESTGAVVSADVDEASAPEEGDGKVFGGGFDVLLVTGDCGEFEAGVARLLPWSIAKDVPILGCTNLKHGSDLCLSVVSFCYWVVQVGQLFIERV